MSEWISVKIRKPVFEKDYLVLTDDQEMFVAEYSRGVPDGYGEIIFEGWKPKCQHYGMEDEIDIEVTHWMELPKEPE